MLVAAMLVMLALPSPVAAATLPQPDPAVVSAMDTIFAAVAAGEDPAAAFQDAAEPDITPWLILGLLAAGAAVGGGLWWRSRSGHTLE